MASSLPSILVGVWLITCFAAAETEPYVPALYVFGDALADAGNNNYILNCTVRADFTPYGVSYFPYPTGRWNDGRTYVDFLASYLGFPFPPPYLQPEANFTTGINFASGGSGILDTTGAEQNVLSMSKQVYLFEQYYDNLTEAERAKLNESLFILTTGNTDITTFFDNVLSNGSTLSDFITLMVSKLDEYIRTLYNHGARKFIIKSVPPMGCVPGIRKLNGGNCSEDAESAVEEYNTALKSSLTQLEKELDEGTFIRVNVNDFLKNVIENGEANGFYNTTWACCGSGEFGVETSCGKTDPPNLFCDDPRTYVFWDGVHATERLYQMVAKQIWSGNTSVVYPFNLSTLVSAEPCLNSDDAPTYQRCSYYSFISETCRIRN